jgi:hypothetical protein
MFKKILKNLKTTLLGSFTGLPVLLDGISTKDTVKVATGLGLFLIGLTAKDADDKSEADQLKKDEKER